MRSLGSVFAGFKTTTTRPREACSGEGVLVPWTGGLL